jgi:hypothetical protein
MNDHLISILNNSVSKPSRPTLGISLSFLGGLMLMLAITAPMWMPKSLFMPILKIFTGVITLVGIYIYRWGQKLMQPTLAEALKEDDRAPIAFFRAFRGEKKSAAHQALLVVTSLLHGSPFHDSLVRNLEEHLDPIARYIGPLVAIGRPNDTIAQLGATRIYCSNEQWKNIVLNLLQTSRIAIFIIKDFAPTNATFWELTQARLYLKEESIFVIVTSSKFHRRKNQINNPAVRLFLKEMDISFSEFIGMRGSGILCRTSGGMVNFIKPIRNPLRYYHSHPLADALHRVFMANGLLEKEPSFWSRPVGMISGYLLFAAVVFLAIFLFGLKHK